MLISILTIGGLVLLSLFLMRQGGRKADPEGNDGGADQEDDTREEWSLEDILKREG